jgi:hypothetical protein
MIPEEAREFRARDVALEEFANLVKGRHPAAYEAGTKLLNWVIFGGKKPKRDITSFVQRKVRAAADTGLEHAYGTRPPNEMKERCDSLS